MDCVGRAWGQRERPPSSINLSQTYFIPLKYFAGGSCANTSSGDGSAPDGQTHTPSTSRSHRKWSALSSRPSSSSSLIAPTDISFVSGTPWLARLWPCSSMIAHSASSLDVNPPGNESYRCRARGRVCGRVGAGFGVVRRVTAAKWSRGSVSRSAVVVWQEERHAPPQYADQSATAAPRRPCLTCWTSTGQRGKRELTDLYRW